MDDFSTRAYQAKDNEEKFHILARDYENFILKQASKTCSRAVTTGDDEWSAALIAFHKAVASYEPEKGSFYAFASVVIKRQLLDHLRRENRHAYEIAAPPEAFDDGVDYEEASSFDVEVARSIAHTNEADDRRRLANEMDLLDGVLEPYGFKLYDVAASSPKWKRTKKGCMAAVMAVIRQPKLRQQMKTKTKLPYSELLKEKKVTKKILERYRCYIIATIEILEGDYPLLREYAAAASEI